MYPVELSIEETAPLKGFPWLKPTAFLKAMGKMNDISHLLGVKSLDGAKDMLIEFWGSYRAICPRHELFQLIDAGERVPERCIPIFVHGDEGVTYKKNGVLVLSFQGIIGFGTSKTSNSGKRKRGNDAREGTIAEGIPLNFLATGFQTRFASIICPKDCCHSINTSMRKCAK